MQKLSVLFAFLLFAHLSFAQSDKSVTKTFNPKGSSSVVFEFPHSGISTADNKDFDVLVVDMVIKANVGENVLNQLAKAGRYTLEGQLNEEGVYVVTAPNLGKSVTVGGQDLVDEIHLVVKMTSGAYAVSGKSLTAKVPEGVAARDEMGNPVRFPIKASKIEVGGLRFEGIESAKMIQAPDKSGYLEILIDKEPLKME